MTASDEWVDLPEPQGQAGGWRYDWNDIVARLRAGAQEAPGKWVKVLDDAPTSVTDIARHRRVKALRMDDGVVQARTRNTHVASGNNSRRGDIWMRFVPHDYEEASDGG